VGRRDDGELVAVLLGIALIAVAVLAATVLLALAFSAPPTF
jgi:hypothetical protein